MGSAIFEYFVSYFEKNRKLHPLWGLVIIIETFTFGIIVSLFHYIEKLP